MDYKLIWWDRIMIGRRRNEERPITLLEEMKVLMRRQFVPNHYYIKCLESLNQCSKSMDEYYKEMEITMIWANVM
jgi:hypothetical protein